MTTDSAKDPLNIKGMEEPEEGDQMPNGETPSKPAGPDVSMGESVMDIMPEPGMEEHSAAEKVMPAGSMMEPTETEAEMPTGGMAEPAATGGAMPTGNMVEQSDSERFRPDTLTPGTAPPTALEPGLVEVELREGIGPKIISAAAGATHEIMSPAGVSLRGLNKILQQYKLERAESSFKIAESEAFSAQEVARRQGAHVPNLGNFVTLHFPAESDTRDIAQALNQLPEVERAVAVPKAIPPQIPLDEPLVGTGDQVVTNPVTGLENQWYIFRCGADRAWTMASGDGVIIADIDWGYRISHQDLASRLDLSNAYNAYDGGTNVSTGNSISHGTAVMGIAGGADNNLGMAGFAFNATLWPVQADSGPGPALGGNAWARAIDWVRTANSNGKRKVIILEVQTGSYGNYEMMPSVNTAIRTAIAHGVVVCVAAGNGDRDAGIDDAGNPIPETGSILVGATAYDATENRRAGFSNFGQQVVVCAPGDGSHDLTCSSTSDSAYRNGFGGTSGATPKVAGTVALMLDLNPNLTHEEVRTILNTTGGAVVTDSGKPVGTFLNTEAAVRAVKQQAGGRLEVFARGANKALYHKWQVTPNGGWSGWASMGGWIDMLATGKNADGRLEVFVRGASGALYHKWQKAPSNGWSGWASLGGWIDRMVVDKNEDGRLEVFARGSNKALYHKWQVAPNGGWSDWSSMGGWIDMLATGKNADGRLEVFVRGASGALYHKWQKAPNNRWSGWTSMGGWIDKLTVGQNADGRLEVFARGSDKALWHKWQVTPNGGWSGWVSMGGWVDSPVVIQNADGRLEVFVIGSNHSLYHKWQKAPNNGWSGWASMGGWIDRLTVGRNSDGRLEVFARGADGALWHKWQVVPNGSWSNWTSLGGWIDLLAVNQNTPG